MDTVAEKRKTIKDFPTSEKPREKMQMLGAGALSNAELLAILIATGSKDKTAIELSQDIICLGDKGVGSLADLTTKDLMQIKGIGLAKAITIIAAIELGMRVRKSAFLERTKIETPTDVAQKVANAMLYLKKEEFRLVLLDTKNKVISFETISVGILNAALVHPREVFERAVSKNANSMILVHNHPSGDLIPSKDDINLTKRLIECGKMMGIEVLDHIIVGEGNYLSMHRENYF